ncbi:hypothetical protein C9J21_19895 [Photobacterium phosphoreum]|uniref:hypothetical protein n=1 Tax=Photobacterium phosphoreum TaxID=659 RepID=UPI000D16F8B4|nr:hypothetical protein [Photobacterium phosphoreum]PSW29151.1 hypothetical protein C9J21_19895 [Photobacterium phosphoreum]
MSDKTLQIQEDSADDFAVFSKETACSLKKIDGEITLEEQLPINKYTDTDTDTDMSLEDKEEVIINDERVIEDLNQDKIVEPNIELERKPSKVVGKKSSNKMLYCITGIALLVGISSVYISINALGTARASQQSNDIYQKQIDTIKSQVLEQQQLISSDAVSIKALTETQKTLDDEINATAEKVAATDNRVTTLQNLQNSYAQRLTEIDSNISIIDNKSHQNNVEIKNILEAKALAHKQAKKQAAIRSKAAKRHTKPKPAPSSRIPKVATVDHIGGIRLASIDMWNNHYSATLTTQNGYRVIYPGYNINGFIVQSITPHYVNLMSPNNTLLHLVN